jgi:hypothetical protein
VEGDSHRGDKPQIAQITRISQELGFLAESVLGRMKRSKARRDGRRDKRLDAGWDEAVEPASRRFLARPALNRFIRLITCSAGSPTLKNPCNLCNLWFKIPPSG